MSLYDDASLVMIPSGIKDGKLYSVKPDDGVGDFTFTRGSNLAATTVNENGLIEKGRENLLLQSNQFDTTWTNSNSSETSGQSGYDGSSDAWLITKNDAFGFIKQAISSSGTQTFSVYAKASDSDWIRLYVNGVGSLVYFNLSTGVVGGASSVIDSNIDSIGNGWYRCSIAFSGNTTEVYIYPAEENSVSATSGSVYIQDAQLELGLVATDYIETGATTEQAGILENLPRLDYSGGASCPSLLLEPTRTNLVTNSEYFGDSSFQKLASGTGSIPVVTTNQGISPDGNFNASKIIFDRGSGTSNGDLSRIFYNTGVPSSNMSVYLKSFDGVSNFSMQLSNGSVYKNITVTGEWQRFDVTEPTASSNFQIRLVGSYGSDTTATILAWGAQAEVGSYPTSYIPTYGTSVTRSGDLCVGAGDATTFNDAEGVLFVDFKRTDNDFTKRRISLTNGVSTVPYIIIEKLANNSVKCEIYDGVSASGTITSSILANARNKIAYSYKQNEFKLFINGTQSGSTLTTGNVLASGTLTKLSFSNGVNSTDSFKGRVNKAIYFPTTLTDSELEALTTI